MIVKLPYEVALYNSGLDKLIEISVEDLIRRHGSDFPGSTVLVPSGVTKDLVYVKDGENDDIFLFGVIHVGSLNDPCGQGG